MRFDLHVHTEHSGDSKVPVEDALQTVKEKGLDGVAFTDHNTMSGYRKAKGLDPPLIIVPGEEVSTPVGHVLALGIEDEISRQPSIKDAIQKIRQQGGLAVAPHPYRTWSGIGEENLLKNDWDAVECRNGRSWRRKNGMAEKVARDKGYPVTAGSDAHRLKSVGKTYTEVREIENWEDVIREIREGHSMLGGENRSFIQTFFYVRRALFGWVRRGFKRI